MCTRVSAQKSACNDRVDVRAAACSHLQAHLAKIIVCTLLSRQVTAQPVTDVDEKHDLQQRRRPAPLPAWWAVRWPPHGTLLRPPHTPPHVP